MDGLLLRKVERENAANRALSRARHVAHFRGLRDVVRDIVMGSAHPFALSDFAARAIQRGLPVRPSALFADERVLAHEARFICLAIPSLRNLHGDARAWLAAKLRRPPERIEPAIPWNLACGGDVVGAGGG